MVPHGSPWFPMVHRVIPIAPNCSKPPRAPLGLCLPGALAQDLLHTGSQLVGAAPSDGGTILQGVEPGMFCGVFTINGEAHQEKWVL